MSNLFHAKINHFPYLQQRLLWVNPKFATLPVSIQRYDEPLYPYSKALVQATHDLVCGYIFDLAHFLAFGAAGAVALERSMRYVEKSHVVILHGYFAHADYAHLIDAVAFGGDAMTVTTALIATQCHHAMPQASFITMDEKQNTFLHWSIAENQLYWHDAPLARVSDYAFLQRISTEDFVEQIQKGLSTL